MHKGFFKTAAIFGVLSVIFGAFAAHSLKDHFSDRAIAIFETGVRYQFYHVFAIMAVAIAYKDLPYKITLWAGRFFTIGIILFSGSLYCLSVVEAFVQPGYKWLGPLTPLGGIAFIGGWLFLFIAAIVKKEAIVTGNVRT